MDNKIYRKIKFISYRQYLTSIKTCSTSYQNYRIDVPAAGDSLTAG